MFGTIDNLLYVFLFEPVVRPAFTGLLGAGSARICSWLQHSEFPVTTPTAATAPRGAGDHLQ
jgi:hypothetical protein